MVGITYFSVCRESAVQELSVRTETKSRMSLLVSLLSLREWLPKPKLGHELKLGQGVKEGRKQKGISQSYETK